MTTKIIFTLPAANVIGADGCVLLGEFNDWSLDKGFYLQKQADGSMTIEVELDAGKDYQYRYLLSNGRWINDDGEKIISEMSGYPVVNCIIRVPAVSVIATGEEKVIKRTTIKANAAAKSKAKIIKDDLAKIEGISRRTAALLYRNNIYTYKQLSKTTITNLKSILGSGEGKLSKLNADTWPKQAKLAAAAKWEDLELFQKGLKGRK